jgi:hypothetical protein
MFRIKQINRLPKWNKIIQKKIVIFFIFRMLRTIQKSDALISNFTIIYSLNNLFLE